MRARQATDDNITRCMGFAFWINKATNIHSEYVMLIAFPRQKWLGESASMLSYTHIACLVWEIIINYREKLTKHKSKVEKLGLMLTVTLDGICIYRCHWALNGKTL
jgi:hypothetical protein